MAATAQEYFSDCHKDCQVANGAHCIRNWHMWTYHRTCYGNTTIPSTKGHIATWLLDIHEREPDIGYVCVGIASVVQTDSRFYSKSSSPNYGYESTGKLYGCGKLRYKNAPKLKSGTSIEIELDTNSGKLSFAKFNDMNSKIEFRVGLIVKRDPSITYRLAVALKDAQVQLTSFNVRAPEMPPIFNDTEQKCFKCCELQTGLRDIQRELEALKATNNEYEMKMQFLEEDLLREQKAHDQTKEQLERLRRIQNIDTSQYLQWTSDQVVDWILSLEDGTFEEYAQTIRATFKAEEVKGATMCQLDKTELRNLGIAKMPHRKRIIQHIERLVRGNNNDNAPDEVPMADADGYQEGAGNKTECL